MLPSDHLKVVSRSFGWLQEAQVRRMTRDQEYGAIRPSLLSGYGHVYATDRSHHDIGEHQVGPHPLDDLQSLFPAVGLQRPIPVPLQDHRVGVYEPTLIIHNKDAGAAFFRGSRRAVQLRRTGNLAERRSRPRGPSKLPREPAQSIAKTHHPRIVARGKSPVKVSLTTGTARCPFLAGLGVYGNYGFHS